MKKQFNKSVLPDSSSPFGMENQYMHVNEQIDQIRKEEKLILEARIRNIQKHYEKKMFDLYTNYTFQNELLKQAVQSEIQKETYKFQQKMENRIDTLYNKRPNVPSTSELDYYSTLNMGSSIQPNQPLDLLQTNNLHFSHNNPNNNCPNLYLQNPLHQRVDSNQFDPMTLSYSIDHTLCQSDFQTIQQQGSFNNFVSTHTYLNNNISNKENNPDKYLINNCHSGVRSNRSQSWLLPQKYKGQISQTPESPANDISNLNTQNTPSGKNYLQSEESGYLNVNQQLHANSFYVNPNIKGNTVQFSHQQSSLFEPEQIESASKKKKSLSRDNYSINQAAQIVNTSVCYLDDNINNENIDKDDDDQAELNTNRLQKHQLISFQNMQEISKTFNLCKPQTTKAQQLYA